MVHRNIKTSVSRIFPGILRDNSTVYYSFKDLLPEGSYEPLEATVYM